VRNIGQIQAQIMSLEKDTKEELSKMAKHGGIKFLFYYDYIIEFDKANINGITPYRLIFSKNEKELIVLHYDLYHENDNLFIVDGKGYTLYEIKKYIRNYFKNVSNINVKSNKK